MCNCTRSIPFQGSRGSGELTSLLVICLWLFAALSLSDTLCLVGNTAQNKRPEIPTGWACTLLKGWMNFHHQFILAEELLANTQE